MGKPSYFEMPGHLLWAAMADYVCEMSKNLYESESTQELVFLRVKCKFFALQELFNLKDSEIKSNECEWRSTRM